jgi:uncharacterized protein YndB with AHSA1/START domain
MAPSNDAVDLDFRLKSGPNLESTFELDAREFVITGIFDAPRDLVFRAWTEVAHLKNWFGPTGFTMPVSTLNLVPSGAFHYCLRAPNRSELWGKWIFREIASPERLVFVNTFSNKHGNLARHPFVAKWPLEMLTTVTFKEVDDVTLVTIGWLPINASLAERKTFGSMRRQMQDGWLGTFEQLRTYLGTLPRE